MGSEAAGPMVAILAGAGPEMKVQAIQVLADLRVAEAIPLLLAPALAAGSDPRVRAAAEAALVRLWGHTPSKEQAVLTLVTQATDYLQRRQAIRGESDGRVTLWHWDEEKGQCTAASYALDDAARVLAARLARDALALAPDNRQVRQLYLATMLEEAVDRRGLTKGLDAAQDPVAREAARLGVAELNAALEYALANRLSGACIGAAEVLGQFGKARDGASHRRRAGAVGPSGPRPGPPRPHGGPGGDRAAATGRPLGRLEPRAGIALFPGGRQRRPPRLGRRPQCRRAAGLERDAQRTGLPDRYGHQRPPGPFPGAGVARL